MAPRRPDPSRRPWIQPRRAFADDEAGSFVVLEAVLVALLVLTAILFFTSVQRPSTGTDQGGIDLAQVAADTLSILETRSFDDQDFDEWVTSLARGDAAMADEVDEFLEEILPTGARYSLRIDNGVSSLVLVPHDADAEPHAARAAQVIFLPSWAYYAAKTNTVSTNWDAAAPGQTLSSTANPTLDLFNTGTIDCIKSPIGGTGIPTSDTSFAAAGTLGPEGRSWVSRWQSVEAKGDRTTDDTLVVDMAAADVARIDVGTTVSGTGIPVGTTVVAIESPTSIRLSNAATNGAKAAMTFSRDRVPSGAFYGVWEGHTSSTCTDVSPRYVKVWDPRFRTVTDATLVGITTTSTTVAVPSATAVFSNLELGLPITGPNIPDNARITSVNTATNTVTLTHPAVGSTLPSLNNQQVNLPVYSPHAPYSLQLVVWFGA